MKNVHVEKLIEKFNENKFTQFKEFPDLDSFIYKVNGLDNINADHVLLCKCYGDRFMAIFMGVDGEESKCQGVVMPLNDEFITKVWTFNGFPEPAPFEAETVQLFELVDLAVMMWRYGFEQETGRLPYGFEVLFKEEN